MNTGDTKTAVMAINTYLFQLVRDLEYELANLNAENMNDTYKKEQEDNIKLPIGSVVLRASDKENAGFKYGKWNRTNQTVSTSDGALLVYKREE